MDLQAETIQIPCATCGQPLNACRCQGSYIGTVIADRYELVEQLGSGGMGTVFKARHVSLPKFFAIKILGRQLSNDAGFRARFDQEAKTASLLNNAHLVSIYDHGSTGNGEAYLVMDFIDGRSLAEVLAALKRIDQLQATKIFIQICEGLAHAHGIGVIHRDLKPSNVMLINTKESSDFVKVVDFGIAKMVGADGNVVQVAQSLTKTGEFFGSPLYTSPEQGTGAKPDQRSDIYSLGVLMYECLTSAPPFRGENFFATMVMHNEAQARPFDPGLNINPALEQIVFKCMEKNPDQRFQSMDELKAALQNVFSEGNKSVDKASTKAPKQVRSSASSSAHAPRSSKKATLMAICAATILIGGAGIATKYWFVKSNNAVDQGKNTSSSTAPRPVTGTAVSSVSSDPVLPTANSADQLPYIPDSVKLPASAQNKSANDLNAEGAALLEKFKTSNDFSSLLPARYFTSAAQHEPDNFGAYDNLSGFYWCQQAASEPAIKRSILEKCLQVYRVQLKHFPDTADIYGNMATIYVELNRIPEALECSDKAIALQPNKVDFHLKRAFDLHCMQRFQEAISEYEKWIRPCDKNDLYVQGSCYQAIGESKKAYDFANKWIKKIGPDPGLILVRADAEKELNMNKEAIADYLQWRKLAKNIGTTRLDAIEECKQRLAAAKKP